jgi:tRNA-specific 2-thiouridylase
VPAHVRAVDGGVEVVLPGGEEAVAPGQACVFYDPVDGTRVLGGGWIMRGERNVAAAAE